MNGTKCDAVALQKAATEAVAELRIGGDLHAPENYRRHIAAIAGVRAVELAYERAGA